MGTWYNLCNNNKMAHEFCRFVPFNSVTQFHSVHFYSFLYTTAHFSCNIFQREISSFDLFRWFIYISYKVPHSSYLYLVTEPFWTVSWSIYNKCSLSFLKLLFESSKWNKEHSSRMWKRERIHWDETRKKGGKERSFKTVYNLMIF